MVQLSDEQFKLFGMITSHYASAEAGLKLCLSGMIGIPLTDVFVLTDRLGSDGLRKAAKTIAKQRMEEDLAEQFGHLVGELTAKSRLRNFIAHHRWSAGIRASSIRPAYATGESGRLELFGYGEEETDFTIVDLETSARDLFALNARIVNFLVTSGLDEKTQAVNEQVIEPLKSPKAETKK